jgi:hypothetical protein
MKYTVSALLIGLGLATSAAAAPQQWDGNNHWYDLINVEGGVSFTEALVGASGQTNLGQSGYLATITSQGEHDFVSTNVNPQGYPAWLGGSDSVTEGEWLWAAGPDAGSQIGGSGYSNWYAGEPNDYGSGEDYLLGWWNNSDQWNDVGANKIVNYYVVEFEPSVASVPVPAALPLMIFALGGLGVAARRLKSA